MKGRKYCAAEIRAAAAFAVVLGISGFWGFRQEYGAGETRTTVEMNQEMTGSAGETQAGGGRSAGDIQAGGGRSAGDTQAGTGRSIAEPGVASSDAPAPMADVLILEGEQQETAVKIMEALSQGKLAEAAEIMESREECLQELFYSTLKGRRYLFDGESFRTEIEGKGMVFTKASTVYYGSFKDGKPDGQCLAFQSVDLDAPRYDYSDGMWKNGRMEGEGHTGYCYYKTSPPGEARDICRTGTFSEDLMEGHVTYISINGEDETSTWKFSVEKGVVVTDERWYYNQSTGEYQLMSEDNDSHAYVLDREQIRQPMWQNLLIWDE